MASNKKFDVYIIHGTTRAFCISLVPSDEAPNATGVWVPRSVIAKRKFCLDGVGKWSKETWEMTPACYKQYITDKQSKTYSDEV